MAVLESQCSFKMFTNLPEDVITNTFHWESTGISNQAATDLIAARLDEFYQDCYGATGMCADYVNWGSGMVKVYDEADLPPRTQYFAPVTPSPLFSAPSDIPTEVAVCISYHAANAVGVNQGQLRNRIYLGGLGNNAIDSSSTSQFPMVAATFRQSLAVAFVALLTANTSSLALVQRSRVGLITSRPIVGGWIDNSPDTQRRRGIKSTTRTIFDAPL